jgi:predicted PurR-regulated permease PerM
MDALLEDLQVVCNELLPIVGTVALIFLCILLKKSWKLIEQLTATVKGLDPTLQKVDTSMEKIQAPLDTVVRLSHSVDKVQDKTEEALGKVSEFTTESINNLKDFAAKHEAGAGPEEKKEEQA